MLARSERISIAEHREQSKRLSFFYAYQDYAIILSDKSFLDDICEVMRLAKLGNACSKNFVEKKCFFFKFTLDKRDFLKIRQSNFFRNAIKKPQKIDSADTVFIRVYCALLFVKLTFEFVTGIIHGPHCLVTF